MKTKTAAQIQAEINFMRAMYAQRMNINQPRRDRMIGWMLVGLIVTVPAIVAILAI